MGHEIRGVELPRSRLTYFIEYVERATGFDEFARERRDRDLVRQRHRGELRASHLVPAVEYLQAEPHPQIADGGNGKNLLRTWTSLWRLGVRSIH